MTWTPFALVLYDKLGFGWICGIIGFKCFKLKTGKHIIFLGAGASYRSGYPLANDLRLLISSRKKWEKALAKYQTSHNIEVLRIPAIGLQYWDKNRDVLDLFRNGGFATIDEFCKLAGAHEFQKEIHGLRCFVRAALGLFNPEENFEKSEYYGFIQSLFKDDLMSYDLVKNRVATYGRNQPPKKVSQKLLGFSATLCFGRYSAIMAFCKSRAREAGQRTTATSTFDTGNTGQLEYLTQYV